ncbi:MAG: EI24 domain-containing protein [Alphaproteobacteria bacterium]|nr:EI24 domain-containing protein [Alphaproteobacteria bacterium]MDP6661123.1 EI24 domain-containing protein [Alphaproteobacteria bacterium]MDP6780865.1 EI24 domain-containing protein [Alphaproteobacteria bacterium]MDP7044144.1 EI24 domain-containing protein [Alphaproteobacteria bacterium]
MLAALSKTLGQITDPRIRSILWKTLLLALSLFILLFMGVGVMLSETQFFAMGWLESTMEWLGGIATLVLAWILFPSVVVLILSFFLEDVAQAVEDRHHPDLGPARVQPWREVVVIAMKFAFIAIVLNVLTLPLYILLYFVGIGIVLYYLLNGYLLGREYFELVALRRLTAADAATLRRAFSGRIVLCGALIAFLSSLPLINLLAPVMGTMLMVHVVADLRREHEAHHASGG